MGHGRPATPPHAVKNIAFVIGWSLTMALVSGRVLFPDGETIGRLPPSILVLFLFAMWACVLIGLPLLLRERRRRRRPAAAPRGRTKRRRRVEAPADAAAEGLPSGPP